MHYYQRFADTIMNRHMHVVIIYILYCEGVFLLLLLLLLLLDRHTAANTVSNMVVLSTAPMIPPPTHGSKKLDTGEVQEQDTGVELACAPEERRNEDESL